MTLRRDTVLRRETACLYRGRPIIVEMHPSYMLLRVKGLRSGLEAGSMLPYDAALEVAMRAAFRSAAGNGK